MYRDLTEAIQNADQNPSIHVILISGSRECFTAGNDLNDFLTEFSFAPDGPVHGFLTTLPFIAKPVVAAVEGPAIGIGTTLLMHCDLVYAGEQALFQTPFVNFGLVPEFGSTLLFPVLCGHPRAAECLFLGEPFGAEKALELGLINRICKAGSAIDFAHTVSEKIAAQPLDAVLSTKALMKADILTPLAGRIREEADLFAAGLKSEATQQRLRAFIRSLSGARLDPGNPE